jgi:hypothetical protein
MEKFERVMKVINKYSLLIGGIFSLYDAYVSRNSTWEMIAWACAGSSPALGGALDRVRITTVNGTDTFDAGSINILYE